MYNFLSMTISFNFRLCLCTSHLGEIYKIGNPPVSTEEVNLHTNIKLFLNFFHYDKQKIT